MVACRICARQKCNTIFRQLSSRGGFSSAETNVFSGITFQYKPVSSALYIWALLSCILLIFARRALLNGATSSGCDDSFSPEMASNQIPCLLLKFVSHPSLPLKGFSGSNLLWIANALSLSIAPLIGTCFSR